MKIHQSEIDAAIVECPRIYPSEMSRVLRAAYLVRKQRKAAKRERQRKEKDKQVVESVRAREFMDGINAVNKERAEFRKIELESEAIARGIVYPSKAPEWDGKFGVGEWMTQGGDFARVSSVQSDYLMGTLRGYSWTWNLDGGQKAPDDHSRLIRPWPKGEQ